MSQKAPVPETADTFDDAAEMWEWVFQGGWIQCGKNKTKMRWDSTCKLWLFEDGGVSDVNPCHPTRWRRVAPPRRKVEVTMYQNVYRRPDGSFETGPLREAADEARGEIAIGPVPRLPRVAVALPVTFEVEAEE